VNARSDTAPRAIAGVVPRAVVAPRDVAELAAVVAELAAAHRPFACVGGGTELELGNPPAALDTIVQMTGCNRVIDYAPEDQTITVEAGMTFGELDAVLAANGQFLALDAADRAHATIGGAIATNRFGRRRQRFGAVKDAIVGIEIVRPDGVRARGGGKVVKNVAGFDMPKLMTGSLGTLGAIANATFRVHPVERHAAGIRYTGCTAADVMRIGDETLRAQLVPTSLAAYESGSGYDVVAVYEGVVRGVIEQLETAARIARELNVAADQLGGTEIGPLDERERAARTSAAWRCAISASPVALGAFVASGALAGTRLAWYPLLGAAFVASDGLDAATIAAWRSALPNGYLAVHAMPAEARASVDAWGTPPPSLPLMRRLKTEFDPLGVCNPGRFVGGI
jgi:glycolate oxidase FAD binding subunit